jgi:hypothetical protein
MGLIEMVKKRPTIGMLFIGILLMVGFVLFSGMLSIFEEGRYVALRPVDGSQVVGLSQEINVDVRFENIHTLITSGTQKPYISITGINTTYLWNTTPSVSYGETIQRILYHSGHMFPGFGFYRLDVSVYYLYQGNASDVRLFTESSTFEIVESLPELEPTLEPTNTTGAVTLPTQKEENALASFMAKGLGVTLLGVGALVVVYIYFKRKKTGKKLF